ncbi:unnamed protein product [Acidocella sp. C78]|uniref:hypothetical protein n=1 Tax=Acidocella sp. C78 TaxID=1671486 RepID=UPI001BBFA168|nr:hypothetical protein [Acidocella sp. C78]CAG4904006.1 unnamed protein product [Acidocella sp. C78]
MSRRRREAPRALAIAVALAGIVSTNHSLAALAGRWSGHYHCAQGDTALDLTISPAGTGRLRALFFFHALAGNPHVPPGCFSMAGRYDAASGSVALNPTMWLLRPHHFVWVGLRGRMEGAGGAITGRIDGPGCTDFSLVRVYGPMPASVPPACRMERGAPTV